MIKTKAVPCAILSAKRDTRVYPLCAGKTVPRITEMMAHFVTNPSLMGGALVALREAKIRRRRGYYGIQNVLKVSMLLVAVYAHRNVQKE